ncbi:hypothetical protein BH09PAT2_BH09PAT2_10000 [soil metagenome]
MIIKTEDSTSIQPFLKNLYIPPADSHKGNNGRVLIIGGSKLFHSASLWAAEIASHFTDMVHYASTKENNQIFHDLKTAFRNGIVVEQKDIPFYIEEDDAVLLGPGMVRNEIKKEELSNKKYEELMNIEDESVFTRELTHYLITTYPEKRYVIDAGALQMMDVAWLKILKEKPIITPHQYEFERLFGESVVELDIDKKADIVQRYAREYNCVILLKAVLDIVSDGERVVIVEGGNQGLTKGGSGDILAGITVSLRAKNNSFESAVIASYSEKTAADTLEKTRGYWYNMTELIHQIPESFHHIINNK